MNLKQVGTNMTELSIGDNVVLFSYSTPVAAHGPKLGAMRTSKRWSVTTSKHIGKWFQSMGMESKDAREMGQEYFDSLIAGVK